MCLRAALERRAVAGFIGDEQLRKVRDATDLVQLVGQYVPVQRSGVNFKACCPFHDERTPSFYIYTDDAHYHCYGCAAHGDAIDFVREKENLEFVEAVEFLARQAGVEVVYERGSADQNRLRRSEREDLLELMERSTALYECFLWERPEGAEARAYLAKRGLQEETGREFRLGWAPGRNALVQGAIKRGVDPDALLKLNLAMDRNGQLVDRFFDRLLFPICDRFGQPIAFSGRLLPAAERAAKEAGRGVGKYVNSTDTPLYHKRAIVYNMHRARGHCRKDGRLLIMEGPTDVMAAHQAGLANAVAVLGTALTEDHARQLGKAIGDRGRVVLLFDGDSAGQSNSIKAVRTCLAASLPTRVAVLPAGADPAELLAAGEQVAFEAVIAEGRPDIVHLLRSLAPRPHQLAPQQLWQVADDLLATLVQVADPDMRDDYLDEVSRYLAVDILRLHRRLANLTAPVARVSDESMSSVPPVAELPALDKPQETVLHLLIRHPDCRDRVLDEAGVEPRAWPRPWSDLVTALVADPAMAFDQLRQLPPVQAHPAIDEQLFRWRHEGRSRFAEELDDPEQVLASAIPALQEACLEADIGRLEHEMRIAQQDGDVSRAGELFGELMALQQQRTDLRQPGLAGRQEGV